MKFEEIQELIKLVKKTNLSEFKMEDGDFKISIRTKNYKKKTGNVIPQVVSAPQVATSNLQSSVPTGASDSATNQATESETPKPEKTNYLEIKSPIVGTFYRSASPDKPPYVKVGDSINTGDVVCIVEAMKLFNEIESEISGSIVKVLVDDAQPIEYDQVLFLVDPNS